MAKDIVAILQELANNPDASKRWELPWRNAENYARNPTSDRIYQGMNQMILSLTGSARGYKMNRWAGEGQWKKLGGKVKPGGRNRGVQVLVPREGRSFTDSTGKQVEMGRYYSVQTVYNVDEIAGLPESFYELGDVEINQEQRLQDIENVIKEIGPSFVESLGSQAFYRPATDKIHMPAFEQFKDALAFYGTAMHETIHWTSHPSRLDRKLGKTFGDEDYAFEELIAEIGSAFAMGAMGLEPTIQENHLLYLSSWIKKLQKDPLAIHRAILQAQKANDYIMDRSATMRKLAGIPDGERKGKDSGWFEIPMIAGYPGGEKIKSPTTITGPMEDLLDMEQYDELVPDARNLSIEEREMRSFQIHPNAIRRNKDGVVITPSGALASGKKAGPIKSRKGAPDVERTDEDISMKFAFGLSNEPTNEQRDIMDVVMRLVREKNPQIMSILAGAGTGKTTTLKSIAWALAREFNLWPEGDERRKEQLKYLADRYKIDFSKMSSEEIALAVAKLAKDNPMGNMYYTVFNTKNQHEAEKEFPKNTGIATTDKLFLWSLMLGGGDKRFGPAFRRKMAVQKLKADNSAAGSGKDNPKFISKEKTPDEPRRIGSDFVREHFDGTIETFVGEEPGYRTLGWQRLDDAVDWIKFLGIDKWPDQQTRRRDRVQKDSKGRTVRDANGKEVREQYDESIFILPDGRGTTQVTTEEMADILSNALGRWEISKEEKAAAWMFTPSAYRAEGRTTPKGQGKDIHVVDTVLTEDQVPKLWVEALQQAIDAMMDGNSNMIPRRDSVQKLWLLSNPDLRTDPGLITHSENQTRNKVPIPNTYKVGDKYVDENGEEWIVAGTSRDGSSSKVKARLAKRVATVENPLSAFMVDESQDSNEILETVLENNRKNLPIILVGDDRQAVYAFRDAKNILDSLDAEYSLSITESFRYGPVVAHLTNMALGRQNLYLRGQEVPQSMDWKHVKGQAQEVINMLFDPVLAKKDRKGANQVPEINDKTRALIIDDIEKRFSTPDKKIEISDKTRVAQDAILKQLRDELYDEREGKIVDFVELANQGIFPDAILTGTNAEIIDWALKFIDLVINRPNAEKDENGFPKIPEVVIPAKKHEDLLAFTIQLDYIMKSPEQQAAYEKIFGGRPPESQWLGPVWTQGRLQQLLKQSRSQQLTTAYRLITTAPPGQAPLGTRGMLTLLRGENIVEEVNGKQKIRTVPAVLLPERKTQQLNNFTGDDSDPSKGVRAVVMGISRGTKAAEAEQASDSQRKKIIIIPQPTGATDGRSAVYAQLEINGGSSTKPGKPTGKIIITGDGVDSNRPKINDDGSESRNKAPNQRVGNGRFRRNLEKIIQRYGLQDKVKPKEEAEGAMKGGSKRRLYDGWVIEGETLQESSDILELLGQALRDEAKEVGGDVQITTMALSKGREFDYLVMADDIDDPDDLLPQSTPKGEASIGWMQATNLIHVGLSRAKKMIDPGAKTFAFYLHDQKTKPVREAMAQAVKDGHIPEGLDRGAFGDEGGIPLPDFYQKLNAMRVEDINFDNLPARGGAKPDPSTGLSSGAGSGPKNTPTRRDGRLNRRGSSGGSRIYDGSGSAQEIAGIRFRGDLKSPKEQAKLNFSMNVWKRFRDVGIAIDVDDDASETEARKSKNAATIKSVGAEMKKRQNLVRVGRVGDNNVNDAPSALTWMLSVDKLAETLRVPTEFVSANRDGKSSLQWTQTRPVTRKELATLLGLNGPDTAALEAPDAGINHDAVRLLIAELGKQPELSAWRYFSPVSAEEVAKIIPPSPSGDVEGFSKIDLALENVGRANMRDRFIIETFGKDAFPHWFDPEEGESITPDEYSKLGEISAVSKFRATGRFDPEDPTKGDSEAEYDLYGELIDGVLPSAEPDGEIISGDKTSREDFELEQLLKYLGIDRQEWKTTLKERMSAAFGMDAVGAWDEWKKDGIPTATVAHMIRTGLIPNAASVWKDASTGERFDNELKKSKYAVYEALNEFIDKSFPDSKLNSQASRNKITGRTDMGVALRDAATAKGSAWSPKKGNEARFSDSELQSIVDRFNEVFGTNHTIDDIFSAEQLRTAAERIESGETLSGKKRKVS
jgi:antirestriction protein ArdC